jgi:hypothetical protein
MAMSLFPLGLPFITPGALRACMSFPMPPQLLLFRHARGDWGDVPKGDARLNEQALSEGSRIVSVYQVAEYRFYVITEADRGSTTILLAHEY